LQNFVARIPQHRSEKFRDPQIKTLVSLVDLVYHQSVQMRFTLIFRS